jgi:hypothetical protein
VLEYRYTTASVKEYQQKHIIRTIFYSKTVIVILFVLVIVLARSVVELNNKRIEMSKIRDDTEKEMLDLKQKKEKAEESLAFIKTPRGEEEYIRTTHPVVKEGEGVIIVYDNQKSPVSNVRERISFLEKLSIWWNSVFRRGDK